MAATLHDPIREVQLFGLFTRLLLLRYFCVDILVIMLVVVACYRMCVLLLGDHHRQEALVRLQRC